jgi:hypothetical protein
MCISKPKSFIWWDIRWWFLFWCLLSFQT